MARHRPHTKLTLAHLGEVELGPVVGEGGAAWVHRARGEREAMGVKISREIGAPAEARLRREAIARAVCGGLGGPLDSGFVGGRPALSFRWVEGETLATIKLRGEAASRMLVSVARDVSAMLARLHLLGWRHGDVKPENVIVIVEARRVPRGALIDLGLAAPFDEPLTGATPSFLPPEVMEPGMAHSRKGAPVIGAEADVFALGRTLQRTAERLRVPLDEHVRLALAPRPGDRPSAATLAGFRQSTVPLDAAYLLTRLEEIERGALAGRSPPEGPARPWVEGLMRALAGSNHRTATGAPLPPLDAAGRRALLARVAGAEARAWSLPSRLDAEPALLTALERTASHGAARSPRDLLDALPDASGIDATRDLTLGLSKAIAAVAMRPDDDDALSQLSRAVEVAEPARQIDDDLARTAITLLRRAGRVSDARRFADARAGASLMATLDAAELARLAGDRKAALAWLSPTAFGAGATVEADDPRVAALRARIALDAGDLAEADRVLSSVIGRASRDEPALAEVRALRAWRLGATDEGLRAIDAVEQADPERRARLLLVRGMLLHGRGDASAALRAFSRAADLALALSATALEASARASAAAAAADAGAFGAALEAANRAIALLERAGRHADVAFARVNRAATLVAIGASTEAAAEARRALASAQRANDSRAAAYARWMDIEATIASGGSRESIADAARAATLDLGEAPSSSDRLHAMAYASLAGISTSVATVALGDRLCADIEPASARWMWWRARLAPGADATSSSEAIASTLEAIVRARDDEAPPSVVGPVLASAIEGSRRAGKGEITRVLVERLSRLVERVSHDVPVSYRASFEATGWVFTSRQSSGTSGEGADADALGLGAGQIELLSSISRALRDRTSLGDLLRQVVDGLVLWVGVERGLLLLRAPSSGSEGTRLVPRVARGLSREDLRGEQLALSTTLAARALATLEPVVAVDASSESGDDVASSIHALRLRSVLAVPLVSRGEALGVVYLDDRIRRGAFGPREIAWVRLLATQAASAIADTRDALRLRRMARRAQRAQQRLEVHLQKTEGALEIARAQLATIDPALAGKGRDPRGTRHRYDKILGDGPAIRRMLAIVDRVTDAADARIPVLVVGESGTGKELVARAIHENGPRRTHAFVAENCGAIPEPLLESTLFGHVRGAFTGADRARIGLFEIANGGTLLLDEIGEMGAAMQAKLLRVLQEGEVRPVGSERTTKVDVRVIGATHRNLEQMVRDGKFREDLYYRLAVVAVTVPALRDRTEDLPTLVEHLVRRYAGDRAVRVTKRALGALSTAPWPGNVRQLENEVRRALVLCDDLLDIEHLSPDLFRPAASREGEPGSGLTLRAHIDALELRLVTEALRRAGGNQTQAARALGLSRFGLQKMLKRLGLAAKG